MKKAIIFSIFALLLLSLAVTAISAKEKQGNNALAGNNENRQEIAKKITSENNKEIEIKKANNAEKTILKSDSKEAETELEIEEETGEQNKTKLKIKLSNGRKAEIKIMPDTASEKAIERLGELNFTIQLKETGKGNETKLAYEVQAERHYKLLGLFRTKAENKAEIDAETGEVISVKKPWWAFLATEKLE